MHLSHQTLLSLAQEFGTPLYVYNGDLVIERYKDLLKAIQYPHLKLLYAMKANYNPALLKILLENGAYLDTVSPAEVELSMRLGFPADRLLYTANNITDDEMKSVHERGVLMNIGSLSRLKKFAKMFPNARVCVRFNPNVVAGAHAKIQTGGDLTKFGILLEDADKVASIAKESGLHIVGLHKHTGSGIRETDKFLESMGNLLSIATKERFPELEFLDFGGGFAVPYKPQEEPIDYTAFGKQVVDLFSKWCGNYGKNISMCFEPGRYIVAQAGYLLVQVNTLKNNKGRLIAGTNSGFPQLIRPTLYDAYHHIVNLSNPDGASNTYDICGNICESGDLFAKDRQISEIREGDMLAIQNAGAYCYAMGGEYNLRPMPTEVVVHNGIPQIARKGLTVSGLIDKILGECQ